MPPPRPTRPPILGPAPAAPRGLLDLLHAQIAQQADTAPRLSGANSQERLLGEEGNDRLMPIPPHKPQVTDWGLQAILPTSQWRLRGIDAYGSGAFGARRKHADGRFYQHQGLDIAVAPGTPINSPADGTIEAIGPAYKNVADDPTGGKLKEITVVSDDGHRIQIMYVVPRDDLAADMPIHAGEMIGQADDMTAGRKGLTNHVHIQIPANKRKTIFFDPTPWVLSWIKRHHDD